MKIKILRIMREIGVENLNEKEFYITVSSKYFTISIGKCNYYTVRQKND